MGYHVKLIQPIIEYHVKPMAAFLCFASLQLHGYGSNRHEALLQAQRVGQLRVASKLKRRWSAALSV